MELGFDFVVFFLERNVKELNQLREKALRIEKMCFDFCQPPASQDSTGDNKILNNHEGRYHKRQKHSCEEDNL